MHDLSELPQLIDTNGYIYVFPNGPLSVPLGSSMVGFAWAPLSESKTEQDVTMMEDLLLGFVDEIMARYHTIPGEIILGGFSQGAILTYQIGLPRPGMFAGLISLSGFIEETHRLKTRLPSNPIQPVFIAHGTQDEIIPIDLCHKSRDFLKTYGYSPSFHEYQTGHQVTQDMVQQQDQQKLKATSG